MRAVTRDEIIDYQTYGDRRAQIRPGILKQKERRRIHVGKYLTFLFENHDTVLYQIQEMMHIEHIVRETDILHEMNTYNELLGGPGELGCTLLIEIEGAEERDRLLRTWLGLPEHAYAKLEDGAKAYADFDSRQTGRDRLSSVQYLKFDTKGKTPVALGCDLPSLQLERELSEIQQKALSEDLAG